MTLVTLPKPIFWPDFATVTAAPSLTTLITLDGAGDHASFVACAKEDMVISHVGFKPGTASGSPTVDVRIETVNASGMPSGTLFNSGTTNNSNIVTSAIASNTFSLQALTGAPTILRGQMYAAKIAYNSGTSLILQHVSNMSTSSSSAVPYRILNTSGADSKSGNVSILPWALGSNSTTFYAVPGLLPLNAFGLGPFNNTNSAKRGLKFTMPYKCRAIGIRYHQAAGAGDFNAILFDNAGTPAELGSTSTAFDGDHNGGNTGLCEYYFDNAVTLTQGTTYRLVIEPTSATNCNLTTITLPSTDYRSATACGTAAFATLFASSAWDDTNTTTLPLMDLIIDQVDDGTGSGGGTTVIGVIGS